MQIQEDDTRTHRNPLAFPGLSQDKDSETVSENSYHNKMYEHFPEMKIIGDAVATFYGIKLFQVFKNTRKGENVQSRQVCMYFARKYTQYSLQKIGNFFGKKDHATVSHAISTVNNMVDTDKYFRDKHDMLDRVIEQKLNAWENSKKISILDKKLLNEEKVSIITHYTGFAKRHSSYILVDSNTYPERDIHISKMETLRDVLDFVIRENQEQEQE